MQLGGGVLLDLKHKCLFVSQLTTVEDKSICKNLNKNF